MSPRHWFVPDSSSESAYDDSPLPIGHSQTISQPYIVRALMTEMLELKRGDKVLEIGTGSGYQAAILAELTDEVYTIEIIEPLANNTPRTSSGTAPPGTGGIRSPRRARKKPYNDDLLWLPFVTLNYLRETADFALLERARAVPRPDGKPVERDAARSTSTAAARSTRSGPGCRPRGVPLMGAGDWNDGLSAIG